MKADPRFLRQSKEFWAHVRTISQGVGYTLRGSGMIQVPDMRAIADAFAELKLSVTHLAHGNGVPTPFGQLLLDYFEFRAKVLNVQVQPNLMNKAGARASFNTLRKQLKPKCPLPMNKQKGAKRNHAFLTGMVNMLIERGIKGAACDYDPRRLTTVTHKQMPLRTLSRRVDGAFPSVVNPVAIWEIKEYYNTKTFGSRVADGVYETLLDGLELEELSTSANRKIQHLLVVDDYFTWWKCGRSYLCRIVDMLHMGYLDEVLFGREVIKRLPIIAAEWVAELNRLQAH